MFFGLDFAHFIIGLIIIVACIGILFVICRQTGIQIPAFVITIFWIVLCAVLCILAVKFIAGAG